MWHSSFLFQLLWTVNVQYLLIGYSWDLINHRDGRVYTILSLTDYRAVSSSHTGCESLWLPKKKKQEIKQEVAETYLSLNHYDYYALWMAVMNYVLRDSSIDGSWHVFSSYCLFLRKVKLVYKLCICHKFLSVNIAHHCGAETLRRVSVWRQLEMKEFTIKVKLVATFLFLFFPGDEMLRAKTLLCNAGSVCWQRQWDKNKYKNPYLNICNWLCTRLRSMERVRHSYKSVLGRLESFSSCFYAVTPTGSLKDAVGMWSNHQPHY